MALHGRCLYEVLGLTTEATADDIRLAYKKLALQRHPDKLVHSGLAQADATAQFQELLNAYEVLSNPEERAWYDSHRSQILFSDPTSSTGSVPNLFSFFSNSVYSGYDDSQKGFYKVYSDVFDKIYSNEVNFSKKLGLGSIKEAPVMGSLESPYPQVTAFYAYWMGFSTVMDFAWVDEYDVRAGPNRKSRRLMEEENRKLRKKAKREYNETVRGLAKFVKRRDKRVIDMQVKKSLEEEKRKEEEKARKWEEFERGRLERARVKEELDCFRDVEVDENDDDWEFEDACVGRKEEEEEFYCVLCRKKFKSEKQWKNHEKSRKHKEWVVEFRESVKEEDERYGTAETRTHGNGDQSEVEFQDQFEAGLGLEEEEIEDGVQSQSCNEEEVLFGYVGHSGNGTNAELGCDDETSVLEAMVSGHRNRKNRKPAVASVWEPGSSVTEAPGDINIDEMDLMESDNRKSLRRRRGKRDKGKKSDGEAMKPDNSNGEAMKPDNSNTEKKDGQDCQNNSFDASHVQDASAYSIAENETGGMEDHHAETNKILEPPISGKVTSKGEIKIKLKESNKVRKAKVAQRKTMGNTCETCGEDFGSRNKLHKHLGETGHAMLRAR